MVFFCSVISVVLFDPRGFQVSQNVVSVETSTLTHRKSYS